MNIIPELMEEVQRLATSLFSHQSRIVFAESCTGGLISALLTTVAGISEWHCGSAVVYRVETKAEWLNVDREPLNDPGPVSEIVARQMAEGVLRKTPEARIAASVTGFLGPGCDEGKDGLLYIGIAAWDESQPAAPPNIQVFEHWLQPPSEEKKPADPRLFRIQRQQEAALAVFQKARQFLMEQAANS